MQSSVLGKVLGVLVIVLVVSIVVTAIVDGRLTDAVVAAQTRQIANSDLRVLAQSFSEREANLVAKLQPIAARLAAADLADTNRRPELLTRLSSDATSLGLDDLDVVDSDGAAFDPPISVGRLTPLLPITSGRPFTTEPATRLLATRQGAVVQAVTVMFSAGSRRAVLLGGEEFGDALAFELRQQLGGVADVVLLKGNQLVGTTMAAAATAAFPEAAVARPSPRMSRVGGQNRILAFSPVARSSEDPVGGKVGVVLADPAAPLDRALSVRRGLAAVLLALMAVGLGWLLFRVLTQPLVTLAGSADRIAGGDLDEPFAVQGSDEISRLAGALEHMRQELQAKMALIQESSQRIVAAHDEERSRLARDLHDGIQQELLLLRLRLGLAEDTAAPVSEASLLRGLGQELDGAIQRLREVSQDLYPAILRDRGLAAAVHSYAARLPLSTRLSVTPDPLPRVADEIENAAYFIICEAVTNALKHAEANELAISLVVDERCLAVRVADDGRGFDPSRPRHGGLLNMEDRVRSFAGSLRVETHPGAGTAVEASLPVAVLNPLTPPTAPARLT